MKEEFEKEERTQKIDAGATSLPTEGLQPGQVIPLDGSQQGYRPHPCIGDTGRITGFHHGLCYSKSLIGCFHYLEWYLDGLNGSCFDSQIPCLFFLPGFFGKSEGFQNSVKCTGIFINQGKQLLLNSLSFLRPLRKLLPTFVPATFVRG